MDKEVFLGTPKKGVLPSVWFPRLPEDCVECGSGEIVKVSQYLLRSRKTLYLQSVRLKKLLELVDYDKEREEKTMSPREDQS